MIIRLMLSMLVTVIVATGTVRVWNSLTEYNNNQISRIIESESYATRSQLIRNVERMFAALDGAQTFWATYGQLPRNMWTSDADIEIAKIEGVTTLLWDDPSNNVRFARTAENPNFDFRPDDSEWNAYKGLLIQARQLSRSTMAGPFLDRQGNPYFEIYLVEDRIPGSGRLIAVVDAQKCLHNLLRDESPGYAVRVYWRNVLLFSRGEAAENIPADWTRQGMIKSSLNSLWKVVHTPDSELAESFKTPAIDMILLLGLIIAVLMGTLTFENWRAHTRARAAEKAEHGLAELNRHLEQEIANRTSDLQTISDSVAHDLRNPLNAIAVNAQLLEIQNAAGLAAGSRQYIATHFTGGKAYGGNPRAHAGPVHRGACDVPTRAAEHAPTHQGGV